METKKQSTKNKHIKKTSKKLKTMLTVEAKNQALRSLADAPVGAGIVLSAYGFAAVAKAQRVAEEKAKIMTKPKAKAAVAVVRRPAPPLQPLASRRRRQLLLPIAAASEGCEAGDEGSDEDDKGVAHRSQDACEGSFETKELEEEGNGGNENKDNVGEEEEEEEEEEQQQQQHQEDKENAPPAGAAAWGMSSMISNAASKFRVAGISRKRRLE